MITTLKFGASPVNYGLLIFMSFRRLVDKRMLESYRSFCGDFLLPRPYFSIPTLYYITVFAVVIFLLLIIVVS